MEKLGFHKNRTSRNDLRNRECSLSFRLIPIRNEKNLEMFESFKIFFNQPKAIFRMHKYQNKDAQNSEIISQLNFDFKIFVT